MKSIALEKVKVGDKVLAKERKSYQANCHYNEAYFEVVGIRKNYVEDKIKEKLILESNYFINFKDGKFVEYRQQVKDGKTYVMIMRKLKHYKLFKLDEGEFAQAQAQAVLHKLGDKNERDN